MSNEYQDWKRDEIEELKARVAELEESLKFYADQGNYYLDVYNNIPSQLSLDNCGDKARTALEKSNG